MLIVRNHRDTNHSPFRKSSQKTGSKTSRPPRSAPTLQKSILLLEMSLICSVYLARARTELFSKRVCPLKKLLNTNYQNNYPTRRIKASSQKFWKTSMNPWACSACEGDGAEHQSISPSPLRICRAVRTRKRFHRRLTLLWPVKREHWTNKIRQRKTPRMI